MPYIQGISDQIKRILNSVDVKVAFKPHITINSFLPKPKDPIPTNEKYGLVYQIPCKDCKFKYIGETKRTHKDRIKEHKKALSKGQSEKSAVAEHAMKHDHKINWNDSNPVFYENNYYSRLFKESWLIQKTPNNVNRKSGNFNLPSVYKTIVNL